MDDLLAQNKTHKDSDTNQLAALLLLSSAGVCAKSTSAVPTDRANDRVSESSDASACEADTSNVSLNTSGVSGVSVMNTSVESADSINSPKNTEKKNRKLRKGS